VIVVWRRRVALGIGAVVAVALGAGGLAACSKGPGRPTAAATTTAAPTTTTTEAPLSAGQQVSFYTPVVGNCYDKRTAGTPSAPAIVHLLLPCALPHQYEVYAALDYPGADFPGTNVLEAYARQNCVGHYGAYVGRSYETSVYDLAYELPTAQDWGIGIRHVIGCLVVSADTDRHAGSVRGSGK
jgi:hypothetical protein